MITSCLLQGPGGSPYIVLLLYAFLGQYAMWYYVILDPLGRWNIVCEESPERSPEVGGRPGPGPFRPLLSSRGFWSLLDGRKLRGALISLYNPDMWAFLPYFLITPCRNRQTPKLVEFCQIKP